MLKSTKLKESYLFEAGEVKTLNFVKKIYSVFERWEAHGFVTRNIIIKLIDLENEINSELNNSPVQFISREIRYNTFNDDLVIKVKLI